MKTFLFAILCSFYTTNLFSQTIVKMEKKNGVYYVPCKVNGLPLKFIFDTGASDVIISLTEALFMLKNGYLKESDFKETESYKLANGEIAEGTKVLIAKLEIGEKVIYNVQASVVHTSDAPLLLGQSALKGLGTVTVDYGSNSLILNDKSVVSKSIDNSYPPNKNEKVVKNNNISEAEDFFFKGNENYDIGDYITALEFFNKSIAANPKDDAATFYNRGMAKDKLMDYKGAIQDYSKAIEINPNYTDAYVNRGNAKIDSEDFEGAILDFSKAISIESSNAIAFYGRGLARNHIENYKEAILDFSQSIVLNPNDADSYYQRGISELIIGKNESGCADLKKAKELGQSRAKEAIGKFCNDNETEDFLKVGLSKAEITKEYLRECGTPKVNQQNYLMYKCFKGQIGEAFTFENGICVMREIVIGSYESFVRLKTTIKDNGLTFRDTRSFSFNGKSCSGEIYTYKDSFYVAIINGAIVPGSYEIVITSNESYIDIY